MTEPADELAVPNVRMSPWPARVLRGIAVAYILLVSFPGHYASLGWGLDASWIFGINYAVAHGLRFGRDVAFTYGPLGYLLFPLDLGGNLSHAIAFWLAAH